MPRPAFELRRLSYFVAVAEEGSFRAAALALHVSQPPLTRQIQLLEQELGISLFKRGARGVSLTAAGEQFFRDAKRIIRLSAEAVDDALMAADGHLGRLDLGIFGSAIFYTIPRIVLDFRRRHPRVQVALHNLDRAAQLQALRERRLSAGFNWFFSGDGDIAREVLMAESLVVAVQESHPLAGRSRLVLEDLRHQPLILFPRAGRPNYADHVLYLCRQAGFEPQTADEVDDVVTAVALVSCGFGLCVTVASAGRIMSPGVRFIPLEVAAGMNVELCLYHRRDDDSPLLAAFLSTAREYCAGLTAEAGAPAPL